MFFFDTCNAVAAREDRKPKYWRLGRRHLGLSLTLWRHTVKRGILNMACDCWFPCSCVYWSLVKARKIVWESQVIDSSSITQSEALWIWLCDVTTSSLIQDGGALVVNILVFDLRVQLQHCTYQRKILFFALIKVNTFICKREISGLSSPLTSFGVSVENICFCTDLASFYPILFDIFANCFLLCFFFIVESRHLQQHLFTGFSSELVNLTVMTDNSVGKGTATKV